MNENPEDPAMTAGDVIMAGEDSELNPLTPPQPPLAHCVKYADMLTSRG